MFRRRLNPETGLPRRLPRERSRTVLSGGLDLTMPEPPRRPVDEYGRPILDLAPGRHEKTGRHEAPRVAGVLEIPASMTPGEIEAFRVRWLEARARERSHPILKVSRL
jgi:hypothetical protein